MAQTLEQQIRKVIRQHYGEDLSMFREDVNYKDATKSFVADIARSLRGEILYASHFSDEVAKHNKGGSAERAVGRVIKDLRMEKGIAIEDLAAKLGYHTEFLAALEGGKLAAGVNIYVDAFYVMKPTKKQINAFSDSIHDCRTRESLIQDVIETYYGINLWSFKPDLNYEEATRPFIRSLAQLIKIPKDSHTESDC